MMDDDDLTGESLIFVDFDLTQYGFRAFDWIYHLKSASHKLFVQTNGEEYFISDEELDQWLQVYRNNLGQVSNRNSNKAPPLNDLLVMVEVAREHTNQFEPCLRGSV